MPIDKFTAAAVQMHPIPGDAQANVQKASRFVENAAAAGARLVVLPECCDLGYELDFRKIGALPEGGATRDTFAALAKRLKIFILAGVVERFGDSVQNNVRIFGPSGVLGVYTKIHLFSSAPTLEDKVFVPGSRKLLIDTDLGKVGAIICYDIRFPELTRALAIEGAEIFSVSSAWPTARRSALRGLTLGRAVENLCYLISANQVGENSDGMKFCGCSSIVDFEGNVIAEAGGEKEEVVLAELDMSRLRKMREKIPVFKHRRPEVY